MPIKRNASAHWEGSGKEGKGTVSTASTVLNQTQYSFNTRFADGVGTNPEELVAAAHASCFSMKLAFNLQEAGFTADSIDTQCTISLDPAVGGITESHLVVKASVPGIDNEKFQAAIDDAEKNCPISKLFNTKITVDASLA
ncbi:MULTISPECIES: OsmC family protein [unclassified Spirosoma]|uniref:OsmC family protein n=1 Tax=unclassified Spirosoma TaxID=2621999 RepID=UPI000967DCD9|nr:MULTISPECIES: OsmC family protein [unclassified Spirosoma]MBN8820984.1 OsmC family protein [Spirosoma sp.]OJW75989.1 MAG: OsmC family peroxiredoxin [Spirosoma sp. 48-14]